MRSAPARGLSTPDTVGRPESVGSRLRRCSKEAWLESQSGRVFRSAARSRSVARAERRNGTQARSPFRPIPFLLCNERNSRRYAGAPRASRRAGKYGVRNGDVAQLIASPAAAPLYLALPAEVHSDQEGDGDRQEDPINPVAAREIPKSKARFDSAEDTEYPISGGESVHRSPL
jgi:hypothetical protein